MAVILPMAARHGFEILGPRGHPPGDSRTGTASAGAVAPLAATFTLTSSFSYGNRSRFARGSASAMTRHQHAENYESSAP
jgi:hypothetical protein